ncbi:MAG: potassium transporter TrkA, partial [Rhodothermaceae bacterium]|nr:potassium transporter TrkA [Rhodothermaceae bacterium]
MRAFTVSERLRYWFDNTMSRGTVALIGWLVVLTLLMVGAVVALVLSAGIAPINEDGSPVGPAALVWDSFMQALSPEQVTSDTGGWPYLLAMLALMLGGLLVASTLIGVLTSGIEQKLDALRRGRSIVAETDHIVILGWSSKTPAVVRELVLSNASQRRSCVAVLAPKDRAEMEEAIRDAVGPSGRTRVVCRTGDPIVLGDLDIVNPHRARAVIIPSPESGDDEEHEDPDAKALKMIFALT